MPLVFVQPSGDDRVQRDEDSLALLDQGHVVVSPSLFLHPKNVLARRVRRS